MQTEIIAFLYKYFLKPILFQIDPEDVHDKFTSIGKFLGAHRFGRDFTKFAFNYANPKLETKVLGVSFKNPIGLAAGFDYDGHLVKILSDVGFGFSTVGTVTNLPYEGNAKPRLKRLVKSRSLLVNKGFKSEGADAVFSRLSKQGLDDITYGVSIGSSNLPQIDSLTKAIDDVLECFIKINKLQHLKYFELNISCPNTQLKEVFSNPTNFYSLTKAITSLNLARPVFVKMPNEISETQAEEIVKIGLTFGLCGYIFSNLVKDRSNPVLAKEELETVKGLKGNFSGAPTKQNSNRLLKSIKATYQNDVHLIGLGGVFSAEDAQEKIDCGAELIQLITGMIFDGPQLIGQINRGLVLNR